MHRQSAVRVAVVTGALVGSLVMSPAASAGKDPAPPDTLTKAAYVMTNGNTGTIDLRAPGSAAVIPTGGAKNKVVVSLGDSYISGEAGRWAGNSEKKSWSESTDKLGATAYGDNGGAESLPWCHRSKSAEINFGEGVTSVNLACSGAETKTDASQTPFKPGIDFSNTFVGGGATAMGQALLLQNLAKSNPNRISMVVLSIGGNNFKFGTIVAECVQDYVDPRRLRRSCKDDKGLQALVDSDAAKKHQAEIATAIGNVFTAMRAARYSEEQWTLLVQTYPSPVADSKTIRYGQTYARQFRGGCGFWNNDLDWANNTVLPTVNRAVVDAVDDVRQSHPNIRLLDLTDALKGHRLCETGTTIVGKIAGAVVGWYWSPVRSYDQKNAAAMSEWVAQIRAVETSAPYAQQESLHPNYWGQKAYQSCLRAAYTDGKVRTGSCLFAGLDDSGNPKMRLEPAIGWHEGLEVPTVGRSGPGSPRPVARLRTQAKRSMVVVRWNAAKSAPSARAYYLRVRRLGKTWGPWLDAGVATTVRVPLRHHGRYRVQVVAQNEHGTSALRADRFRLK